MSGWSEHDAIPWRLSQGIAMRGRIVRIIAFGLHDPATDAIDQKRHTDKRAGHNIHVAGKEISAETGHGQIIIVEAARVSANPIIGRPKLRKDTFARTEFAFAVFRCEELSTGTKAFRVRSGPKAL